MPPRVWCNKHGVYQCKRISGLSLHVNLREVGKVLREVGKVLREVGEGAEGR